MGRRVQQRSPPGALCVPPSFFEGKFQDLLLGKSRYRKPCSAWRTGIAVANEHHRALGLLTQNPALSADRPLSGGCFEVPDRCLQRSVVSWGRGGEPGFE